MNDHGNVRGELRHTQPYNDPAFFTTHDLGVTAALICSGYELMAVDKENPNRALFIFRRDKEIEEIINAYWADKLEVKARRYFDSIKATKNKLYSSN